MDRTNTAYPELDSPTPSPLPTKQTPPSSSSLAASPTLLPPPSSHPVSALPFSSADTHIPIPKHSRNTNGLLPLNAKSLKPIPSESEAGPAPGTLRQHRRAQSLKLPLLVHTAFHAGRTEEQVTTMPQEERKAPADKDASRNPTEKAKDGPMDTSTGPTSEQFSEAVLKVSAFKQYAVSTELDLEYMHQNTYIGSVSLEDFLSKLDMTFYEDGNVFAMIISIIETFRDLAKKEHDERYKFWRVDGQGVRIKEANMFMWPGHDSHFALDASKIQMDYFAQKQIKLGCISLSDFLSHFRDGEQREKDSVSGKEVTEAFRACSLEDKKRQEEQRKGKGGQYRRAFILEALDEIDTT